MVIYGGVFFFEAKNCNRLSILIKIVVHNKMCSVACRFGNRWSKANGITTEHINKSVAMTILNCTCTRSLSLSLSRKTSSQAQTDSILTLSACVCWRMWKFNEAKCETYAHSLTNKSRYTACESECETCIVWVRSNLRLNSPADKHRACCILRTHTFIVGNNFLETQIYMDLI